MRYHTRQYVQCNLNVRNILRCGITKTCSRDWAAECNDVADPHADEDHPAENGMARNNDMM